MRCSRRKCGEELPAAVVPHTGWVAALQPRLTVVRKLSAASMGDVMGTSASLGASKASAGGLAGSLAGGPHPADEELPSVMTCANYLKLPP